jgi:RNA polymerase sigma factor (sigma-70 family)
MPTERFDTLLGQLRRAALRRDSSCLSDGDLLERYVRLRDEAAFEALVRQHGAMVHGVCRRVLGNWHDAEDAFQATFLVLARRASSVQPRHRVGNFLYGVAYRTALEARRSAARRRLKEACAVPRVLEPADGAWAELRPVLDRELAGLPEKYRSPVVLCDLEGKTRKQAARQLGWREGTLSGRLARARVLLARRLRRHGVAVAGGALAALLCRRAAAEVPRPLLLSTVQTATRVAAGQAAALPANVAALVNGVHRAMWLSKLKVAVLGLLVVGALGGVGVLSYQGRGAAGSEPAQEAAPPETGRAAEPRPIPLAPRAPYRIEAPDVLRVEITSTADLPLNFNGECLVRPDGTVHLGDLGALRVAGKSIDEVRDAIVGRLKERMPTYRLTDAEIKGRVQVEVGVDGEKQPPMVETWTRTYFVRCTVVQLTPHGRDLGELGKGKVLAEPCLGILEGQEGQLLAGGEKAVPGDKEGTTQFVAYGLLMRVKVNALSGGQLRVEALLERSEPEQADDTGIQIRARSLRVIRRVKLDEPVQLVEKDDRGEPRYVALLRVEKEQEHITRSRPTQAESATTPPARVGQIFIVGNTNVRQDVILRQLPLYPGGVLTYPQLKTAERNLERLGLFRVEPEKGIRPTVKVVDSDADSGFKDIVVTVEEISKPTADRPSPR